MAVMGVSSRVVRRHFGRREVSGDGLGSVTPRRSNHGAKVRHLECGLRIGGGFFGGGVKAEVKAKMILTILTIMTAGMVQCPPGQTRRGAALITRHTRKASHLQGRAASVGAGLVPARWPVRASVKAKAGREKTRAAWQADERAGVGRRTSGRTWAGAGRVTEAEVWVAVIWSFWSFWSKSFWMC